MTIEIPEVFIFLHSESVFWNIYIFPPSQIFQGRLIQVEEAQPLRIISTSSYLPPQVQHSHLGIAGHPCSYEPMVGTLSKQVVIWSKGTVRDNSKEEICNGGLWPRLSSREPVWNTSVRDWCVAQG